MRITALKIVHVLMLSALALSLVPPAGGQTVQLLTFTNFDGANGGNVNMHLTLAPDGNFYGTSYERFVGAGSLFRLATNGTMTPLFSFAPLVSNGTIGTNDTGAGPACALTVGPDGNLYGTTAFGGTNGYGTVFRLATNGGFATLASFSGTNGSEPGGALTLGPDGNLYGTTILGGSNNVGTVFRVTTNGALTSLFSFAASASNGVPNATGAKPNGAMTLMPDGLFYGATVFGGSGGYGAIFKISTNGAFFPVFYFNPVATNGITETNYSGAEPDGGLTPGTDGWLYGAASYGGRNGAGTAFKITTNGTFSLIYAFDPLAPGGGTATNVSGSQPQGPLVFGPDGNLYGATSNGGRGGGGTLFELTPNGAFTLLFTFDPLSGGFNATGGEPVPLTLGNDGNFYGATYWGGMDGYGTLFEFAVPVRLNLQLIGGNAVLNWWDPAYSLQSAPEAAGTYGTIGGAVSPYTNVVAGARKFFRLVKN